MKTKFKPDGSTIGGVEESWEKYKDYLGGAGRGILKVNYKKYSVIVTFSFTKWR